MAQNRETRNLLQLLRNRELGVRKPLTLPMRNFLNARTDAMEYAKEVAGCGCTTNDVQLVRERFDKVYDNWVVVNDFCLSDVCPSPSAISPRMQSPPPLPPPPPPPPQHRAWLEDFEREDRCKYLYLLFYNKN